MSLVGPETQNVPNYLPVNYQLATSYLAVSSKLAVTPGVAQSFLFFKIISESKCKKNDGFFRFET